MKDGTSYRRTWMNLEADFIRDKDTLEWTTFPCAFVGPVDKYTWHRACNISKKERRRLPALSGSASAQSSGISTFLLALLALALVLLWFVARRLRTSQTKSLKRRCSLADLEANLLPENYLRVD